MLFCLGSAYNSAYIYLHRHSMPREGRGGGHRESIIGNLFPRTRTKEGKVEGHALKIL